MSSGKKLIKVAAIAALIIIPVTFVVFVARAQWVHKKLDYYSVGYTGPDKTKATHQVSNIVLKDQFGQRVTMDDFDSCIIVASIFFASCPEVCPKMNGQIEAVAAEFGRLNKIRFLSVSIDPENDSVPVLRQYAERFHAGKFHWQFCTGSKKEIYDWAINDLMLATEQKGQDFIHDDKVVIIDRERYIRSILPSGGKNQKENWQAFKRIKEDIENLMYEYREQDMDKR